MTKEIKYSVKLDVDGSSKIVQTTTSAKDLKSALNDVRSQADKTRIIALKTRIRDTYKIYRYEVFLKSLIAVFFGGFVRCINVRL